MNLFELKTSGLLAKSCLVGLLIFGNTHLPTTALGAEKEVKLGLDEAIELALLHNENIKESFKQISVAEAEVLLAKGVYDLTLYNEFRYGVYPSLDQDDYDPRESGGWAKNYLRNDVGVSQRLPTGSTVRMYYTTSHENRLEDPSVSGYEDQNYLTVELAQSLLKGLGDKANRAAIKDAMLSVLESKEGRSITVSQVTLSVIQSYWSLAIARNNLKVSQKTLKMAKEVYQREIVRHQRGISRGVDVERARLAVDQRSFIVNQYKRDIQVAEEQLIFLINAPHIERNDAIIPISKLLAEVGAIPDQENSQSLALKQRFELHQLEIMLQKLGLEYDVNKNNLLPQLDIIVGYATAEGNDYLRSAESFKGTSEQDSWYAGATFSYPIQNRTAKGAFKQTEKLISIARDRITNTQRSIKTEVYNVIHNLIMAQKGIPLAEEAVRAAKKVVAGEISRFEFGGINNRDLLASHDDLGREEMSYFIALAQYNMALAEYDYAIGNLLTKNKINLDEIEARIY